MAAQHGDGQKQADAVRPLNGTDSAKILGSQGYDRAPRASTPAAVPVVTDAGQALWHPAALEADEPQNDEIPSNSMSWTGSRDPFPTEAGNGLQWT
ncbi:hypothetical protein [Streptomyces sp. NPDC048277]|uniref:hypothetical protein n=1 Tax=Streptomyces sp. NPDC048277 TaxID=3155027 RepID=UPI0033EE9AE8